MKKGLHKKVLAGLLSFSLAIPAGGIFTMAGSIKAEAADDSNTVLSKILGAEDIDIRMKWNDKSNIGDGHQVTLSNGSTITVKDNGTMRKDMTAQQLADTEMGMGINLGNTMEAVQAIENKKNVTGTGYDTAWSQPVTTREYIDFLHTYGINTIRIPIAWSNGDIDDGTYTIRGDMLDRVEEVVNYALDNGMYVVINDHWDNQWWGQFGACKKDADGNKVVDEETRKNAWTRYEKYWTQICERFKNYSDHLIFEGANEELGERLNDGICVNGPAKGYAKPDNAGPDIQVVSGNLKTDELYDTTNKINQKFVDIVRASGGNNTNRHLLIPGYNTDISSTANEKFIMPTDIAENGKNKLFLSVHYYTPGDFCLDNGGGDYTVADQEATKKYFQELKKFSDAGYAVIIGECGVCNPSSVTGSVTQWFYDTFTEAAKYHAVPLLWETGALFDRTNLKLNYKDIAIFLNTINGTNGDTSAERETGGAAPSTNVTAAEVPDYLDGILWGTPGIHAYISYQTATWDYRNAYQPQRTLSNNAHSWEYIQAAGTEVTSSTKVTDVHITADGEYTVAIDGIDLSGANSFKMLSVATDIEKSLYPDITVTDTVIKMDGEAVTDAPVNLIAKTDDKYYNFMLVNVYGKDEYPLADLNTNEKLKMPAKSMEITFKINGLSKALSDIESGEYINQETGKKISDAPANAVNVPSYLDAAVWGKPGIHAYVAYQTATWDYRNAYQPQRTLSNNAHSWEYVQAAGNEATTAKVTDVYISADGEYTVAIDGIDLSGANSFKMLSVATDIEKSLYPDITVTDTVIKIDGEAVTDAPVNLIAKSDDKYYNFMLINVYGKDEYPLADLNENEKLKIPSKSIEVTFKINGLSKALLDIESGEYINPETGKKISDTSTDEPEDPDKQTEAGAKKLKKGATFTSGNYKYKVTKAATASTDGTVALTGLSKKGLKAKKLTVPATVTGSDDEYYPITSIGKKAFSGANATSITLNKKIKEIPSQAFANCKKLTSLTLKAKLSKAAKDSFKGCTKNITVKGTSKKANKNLLNKTSYKNFK